MEQYISKSAVVAEIEKRINSLCQEYDKTSDVCNLVSIGLCIEECKLILSIIGTLEVKVAREFLVNTDLMK